MAVNPDQPRIDDGSGPAREVLLFECAGTNFFAGLDSLDEVLMPALLRKIPKAPPYLLGVLNLRGLLLPVFDLAERLGLAAVGSREWHRGSRILRIGWDGLSLGVVVDGVSGIHHLDPLGRRSSAAAGAVDCLGDLWLVSGQLVQEVRLDRLVEGIELLRLKAVHEGRGL
jgi:chemotaxis signal transduction protein